MRDKILAKLTLLELYTSNPEAMIERGDAVKGNGIQDIGTANDRKMFYFLNTVTREVAEHLPSLRAVMGEGFLRGKEDIFAGWEYLKQRIPVFENMEQLGVLEMARAMKQLGPSEMKRTLKALIDASEGTPKDDKHPLLALAKRAVDTAKKLTLQANEKMIEMQD